MPVRTPDALARSHLPGETGNLGLVTFVARKSCYASTMNATEPRPISILLQTTIRHDEDNWNIERFSMLRDLISGFLDRNAKQLTNVTARDREADADGNDPVLASIASSGYDQVWLIGVDWGPDHGLTPSDCEALTEFGRRGGAIMSMRDHQDLGASICYLGGIGKAHHFHTMNPEPDEERHRAR